MSGLSSATDGLVSCFRGLIFCPEQTALENVELPMMYNGFAGKQRQARAVVVAFAGRTR